MKRKWSRKEIEEIVRVQVMFNDTLRNADFPFVQNQPRAVTSFLINEIERKAAHERRRYEHESQVLKAEIEKLKFENRRLKASESKSTECEACNLMLEVHDDKGIRAIARYVINHTQDHTCGASE